MHNIMHDQLNKLRLISKLQEGQSLDTTNGLTVYEFGIWNWAWRKWNRDNKDEVTRYLQEFYRSVDQSVEQLVSDIRCSKDETKRKKFINIAENLAEKIKASITGIEKLSKTYSQYPKTTSTLEGIVQDFAIVTYKQLMEVIPVENLSKILKENILYNGILLYVGVNDKLDKLDCKSDCKSDCKLDCKSDCKSDCRLDLE